MASSTILVAGATGVIGREVVQMARAEGYRVRGLARSPGGNCDEFVAADATREGALAGLCEGIDVVVSCLGASVSMDHPDKRGYHDVDTVGNLRLLDAARQAGVRRFVYVSVHKEHGYETTVYIQAHEEVVRALHSAGRVSVTVVRPTGVFTALGALVGMAKKGPLPVIGDGAARTNPIHPADAARVLCRYLRDGPPEVSCGGPEVLTRRRIAEMAFEALGRKPRLLQVPPGVMRLAGRTIRLWDRRKGELVEFAAAVATTDCVAPAAGEHRIADYFRDLAGG